MDQQTEQLVREAVLAWQEGALSSFAALVVIDSLLNPTIPTEEDIRLAREGLS